MKEAIHPQYIPTTVECACGNKFETRSTIPHIRLELCSQCHPFYTGRQKLVDTAGRVERFQKRFEKTGGQTVMREPTASKVAPAKKESKALRKILSTTPRPSPVKKDKDAGKKPPKK